MFIEFYRKLYINTTILFGVFSRSKVDPRISWNNNKDNIYATRLQDNKKRIYL